MYIYTRMITFLILFNSVFCDIPSKPGVTAQVIGVSPATAVKKEAGIFYQTKWDPLLETNPFNANYQAVLDMAGYYEDHTLELPPEDRYGDISIMTVNLASDISTEEMNQQSTLTIKEMMDHGHPSIITLQGIREPLLVRLKKLQNDHYKIMNDDSFTKDAISAANYYFPIIVDSKIFNVKKKGYIKNSKEVISASYVVLMNIKNKQQLTVINMDYFSTFKGIVEGQFANMLTDIKGTSEISKRPILFAGGLGAISEQIRTLFNSGYKNLIEYDHNNNDLDRTTVHGRVEHSDNIQRDFIILRDPDQKLSLNYARILNNNYPVGEHYPIHAILSYSGGR